MDLITRSSARSTRGSVFKQLKSMDAVLLLSCLLLGLLGIFTAYAAGASDQRAYAISQTEGFIVGVAGAIPLVLVDYRFWRRFLRLIYGVVLLMLLAVTVIGEVAGGAQRWIDIGPVQVQPSEFAKPLMVLVLAGYLSERSISENMVFLKALVIACVPALLVFLQPDLGTALVFGAIFFVIAYAAGAKIYQLVALAGVGGLAAFLAIKFRLIAEYQLARLTSFSDPSCSNDISYQVCQSKTAIGAGGFIGKGFGTATLANLGFLPNNQTDFVFANLAERVGFVGSLLLLGLFFVLIWRMLRVATISRDRFGVLLAVGISTIFLFHVFVNVGMTMGIMPVTGIPLPFISYGRSSLVVNIMSVGLLESIVIRARTEPFEHPRF